MATMNSIKEIELKRDGRSREAAVGLGAGFVRVDNGAAVRGDWSGVEMDAAFKKGTMGVPCREFSRGEYRYFLRE